LKPKFNHGDYPSEVSIRRSVSASYYALFNKINEEAVNLIAPNVRPEINHRIRRWFDHAEMKKICGRFTKPMLDQPLKNLIGTVASPDLQEVASSFIQLQDSRHGADYDLSFQLTADEAHDLLVTAALAIDAWERLRGSAEANIFILSLLMWKNWEDKERL
jgi:hypothetical protein